VPYDPANKLRTQARQLHGIPWFPRIHHAHKPIVPPAFDSFIRRLDGAPLRVYSPLARDASITSPCAEVSRSSRGSNSVRRPMSSHKTFRHNPWMKQGDATMCAKCRAFPNHAHIDMPHVFVRADIHRYTGQGRISRRNRNVAEETFNLLSCDRSPRPSLR
jgi:hypothetical protein